MTRPMVAVVRPERSEWAMPLRRKPSSLTASITRSTRSCWTCGALLTTRETVLMLTPARLATSTMVGRRGGTVASSCDSGALLVTQNPRFDTPRGHRHTRCRPGREPAHESEQRRQRCLRYLITSMASVARDLLLRNGSLDSGLDRPVSITCVCWQRCQPRRG